MQLVFLLYADACGRIRMVTRNADNDNDKVNDTDNEKEKENVIDIYMTLHYEKENEKAQNC